MARNEGSRYGEVTELASSFIVLGDATILVFYSTYDDNPMNSGLARMIKAANPTRIDPIPAFFSTQDGNFIRGLKWIVGWQRDSSSKPPDYPLTVRNPITRERIDARSLDIDQ